MAAEEPIGRRVAYWRQRRNMSQQVFADRLGKSKSWVDKVERGVRRLDRFSVIDEIAGVLQLDPGLLTGLKGVRPGASKRSAEPVGIEELRAVLERHDNVIALRVPADAAPALTDLTKAVGHACLAYRHSGHRALAPVLPRLLGSAQAADHHYQGDDGRRSAHLLSQVYQIASSSLRTLGENGLAWLAAERAVTASQRARDDLLLVSSIAQVAAALSALGRYRSALELSITIANRVAPEQSRDATPDRLSVYGFLLLQGALAAARLGDPATVKELVSAADRPARQLGREVDYCAASFGPTAVLVCRVAADIELGRMAQALTTHDTIASQDLATLTPECRAQHMLNLARALNHVGDLQRATQTIIEADRLATTEVRRHPVTRELVAEILRRTPHGPTQALTELADILASGHA